jgi:hypothetical protein
LPDIEGKVGGTYFYVKYGKDIPVFGERKRDTLNLEEAAEGRVTGIFRLTRCDYAGESE